MIDQVPPYIVEDRRMLSRVASDRSKPNTSILATTPYIKQEGTNKQTSGSHILSLNLIHSE